MSVHNVINQLLPLLCFIICSCEAFVIGQNASGQPPVERSQKTSIGVAYLFKAEIDSNNVSAATDLMLHQSGT